jgi:hypothetical protein
MGHGGICVATLANLSPQPAFHSWDILPLSDKNQQFKHLSKAAWQHRQRCIKLALIGEFQSNNRNLPNHQGGVLPLLI